MSSSAPSIGWNARAPAGSGADADPGPGAADWLWTTAIVAMTTAATTAMVGPSGFETAAFVSLELDHPRRSWPPSLMAHRCSQNSKSDPFPIPASHLGAPTSICTSPMRILLLSPIGADSQILSLCIETCAPNIALIGVTATISQQRHDQPARQLHRARTRRDPSSGPCRSPRPTAARASTTARATCAT